MARSDANPTCHYNHNGITNESRHQLPLSVVEIATPTAFSSMSNQIQPFTFSSIDNIFKSPQQHFPNHLHNYCHQNKHHYSNRHNHESHYNTPITTTTNIILDYLLYISINARLEQAKNDLQDVTEQSMVESRRKKGQGVDAIVEGIILTASHVTFITYNI